VKTVVHVVGARPNFMKVSPLMDALRGVPGLRQFLVNTGQHYDPTMAQVFFEDLALPSPDRDLAVGPGSQVAQTAKVMLGFEEICLAERPDLVMVVGDVNSTLGAALAAAKLGISLAHVEAGLRSFDRSMPEEINRVVTDQLADLLFTPSADANENLRREGIPAGRIHLVGNIMIDTLLRYRLEAKFERVASRYGLRAREYALLTLHRPANVDRRPALLSIAQAVQDIGETLPVVFAVHPRTRGRIAEFGLESWFAHATLTEPLGYLDFLSLSAHARVVLTDSGGVQEETTVLGIPCLTLRDTTERPVTLTAGTNRLVGTKTEAILDGFRAALLMDGRSRVPALWDGRTAERIAGLIGTFLSP
jgi:UDP-N-acetylglucosamine 2-epimerase (non-hydrolysing)